MPKEIHREDTLILQGLRKQLIKTLEQKGIKNKAVLEAMSKIPRHFFLLKGLEKKAYEDCALEIEAHQTISQPFTVAHQTELLQVNRFDKILEIGTGSAYQSCVLAELGANVFTIERQKVLFEKAKNFFYLKKYPNIKRFYGDGYAGLPTYAPFDKIIITAAAPSIPESLLAQLKVGGIMVIPVGDDHGQKMKKLTKQNDGTIKEEITGDFTFVPMLSGKNN